VGVQSVWDDPFRLKYKMKISNNPVDNSLIKVNDGFEILYFGLRQSYLLNIRFTGKNEKHL
jgi:hypothetical protein